MPRLSHSTDRGRETRDLLRETLLQLSVEKGFDQVTVRDITERAGIDRTTFYLHYTDKHALLEQSQQQIIDTLIADVSVAEVAGEGLRLAFQHIAEHALAYRVLFASADAALDRRLHDHLAVALEPLLRARLVGQPEDTALPMEVVAQFVTTTVRGLARWWLEGEMPYPPETMASIVYHLLAGGLSAADAVIGEAFARQPSDHEPPDHEPAATRQHGPPR